MDIVAVALFWKGHSVTVFVSQWMNGICVYPKQTYLTTFVNGYHVTNDKTWTFKFVPPKASTVRVNYFTS